MIFFSNLRYWAIDTIKADLRHSTLFSCTQIIIYFNIALGGF